MEFWRDDRPRLACCLFAPDEDVDGDPEVFDCATCAVAGALDDLWPENREAWAVSRRLFTRFAVDLRCAGVLLEQQLRDRSREDADDLVERLMVIYDLVVPPVRSDP